MPWNDNKGGGWPPGGGGRGPWGQGPSNGGGGGGRGPNMRPPDLEELFKRFNEWIRRKFPTQSPRGIIVAGVGGLLVFAWLLTGFQVILPAEQGIVLRFGAVVTKLDPGFHIRLPVPIETVYRVNVGETRQVNIGFRASAEGESVSSSTPARDSLMLTGDENIMHVTFTVQWQVTNPQDFLFQVEDPEGTIEAVSESAMREFVGQTPVDQIMTVNRGKIEALVKDTTQRVMDAYKAGVTVIGVSLQTTQAPQEVVDAFNDVQAASADRDRKINEAQKYANTIVPRSKGDAAKIEQDADAFKQQAITLAKGEAQRFVSVYDQYKSSPQVTRERLYVETMQRILSKTNKVILEGGNGQTVLPYLPMQGVGLRPSQPPVVSQPSPTGATP
jgi:membrane protease subunit HflK